VVRLAAGWARVPGTGRSSIEPVLDHGTRRDGWGHGGQVAVGGRIGPAVGPLH